MPIVTNNDWLNCQKMVRETDHIKRVVETSIENINNGQNSFVIYGEPQSGKNRNDDCTYCKTT